MANKNVGTYITKDKENGYFKELVKFRLGQNPQRVKSGEGILNALKAASEGQNDCIKTWIHAQHGWLPKSKYGTAVNGGFGAGTNGKGTGLYGKDPNPQPQGEGRKKGGRNIQDLFNAINAKTIKFCNPCKIIIYGCEISSIGTFAAKLSTIPGCTVVAASGKASTAKSNGAAGTSRDPWRAEGGWDTYKNGKKTNATKGPIYINPSPNW